MANKNPRALFSGINPRIVIEQANKYQNDNKVGISFAEFQDIGEQILQVSVQYNSGKPVKVLTVTDDISQWDTDASANHTTLYIQGKMWYFGVKK